MLSSFGTAARFSGASRRLAQCPLFHSAKRRAYATADSQTVRIVEVGPRDGLQNEKGIIPLDLKVQLIDRLGRAGMKVIEAGSFVSPKWVPQMADTPSVLQRISHPPGVRYPVLVPNRRGLDDLLALLEQHPKASLVDEVAVFTGATDAFTRANTNVTVAESLAKLEPVVLAAKERGMRVRGYVSVVVRCPYSGAVDPKGVRDVTKALIDMGCYEVSLGDTVGMATPPQVREMLDEVTKSVDVDLLAFHDTYGTAVANVFAALEAGVRVFDSSVGGLGGCPYSPGATGNVATEDLVYALTTRSSGPSDIDLSELEAINLNELVDIAAWISSELGRPLTSRAGRAILARRARMEVKAKL
ncbi:hypothetical protein FISHEDRAFT_40817 [Fistulina hepatica ATCC 64428]|uniref:hydroxymethylglutaryl-CoA lyase n=1 Tax=Fistulina hepatica ATCC 64428 TaxID=1128425 RepID=A0A0D7AEE4_9AGAR|nr:hypothetical protein FISHEDRAFT_40817 [Fistulina hepatica ATCC 64428]